MTENIGKKIHDARKAKKLTLTNLASKIGSSAGYLSEIETGKKIPGGELLISLSRELQLNFTDGQSQTNADQRADKVAEPKIGYSPTRMMLDGLLDEESEEDLQNLIFTILSKKLGNKKRGDL